MKLMITILMLAFCATGAMAQQTLTYGWEDGVATTLGTFGNVGEQVNVNDFSHTGDHSLYLTEDPIASTPQAFVAWIAGLQQGDEVTVSFWAYDDTPSAAPSSRIWASYSTDDITEYVGSAGGNSTYSDGTGWSELAWTWTVDLVNDPPRTALVIQFRLYSGAEGTGLNTYWADDVTVTAPDHCQIFFPNMDPVGTEYSTFGGVKALYR
jgi:hypothetical protein